MKIIKHIKKFLSSGSSKNLLFFLIQHLEEVRRKEKIDVDGCTILEFGTGINSANLIHDCLHLYYNLNKPPPYKYKSCCF